MSFQICVRKKPKILEKEQGNDVLKVIGKELSVFEAKKRYDNENRYMVHKFTLDKVFNDTTSNSSIYNNLLNREILNKYKDIFLFAYGETGTGKTHTIFGDDNEVGLFQLLLEDILEDTNIEQISTKILEIYNNNTYDLLNRRNKLILRENKNQKICVKGIKSKSILTKKDIFKVQKKVKEYRKIGETMYNDRSSRSHAIVQIVIFRKNFEKQKITIIDLAGSEKASDTVFRNNVIYTENSFINKNLLALKECIRSTYMSKPHIPFRTCTLTKILRSMFLDDSYTIMMATVSSGEKMCKSTLDTLKYASYIKQKRPVVHSNIMKRVKYSKERDECLRLLEDAKKKVLSKKDNVLNVFNLTLHLNRFLEKSK